MGPCHQRLRDTKIFRVSLKIIRAEAKGMASTHHYGSFFVGHQNKIIRRSTNIINRSTPAQHNLIRKDFPRRIASAWGCWFLFVHQIIMEHIQWKADWPLYNVMGKCLIWLRVIAPSLEASLQFLSLETVDQFNGLIRVCCNLDFNAAVHVSFRPPAIFKIIENDNWISWTGWTGLKPFTRELSCFVSLTQTELTNSNLVGLPLPENLMIRGREG